MPIKGVVSKVSSNPYNGKELWSFRLNGDNAYYNTGEVRPTVQVGQSIEFEVRLSPSGKPTALLDTVKEWKPEPGTEQMQSFPVKKFVGTGGSFKKDPAKDEYWLNKEKRDVRNDSLRELGATRNTSIAFIDLLVKTGALKLPAAEAKREAVVMEALNHYTELFMKDQPAGTGDPSVEAIEHPVQDADGDNWK